VTLSVAIIGSAGACGRQLAAQLLDRRTIAPTACLQLVVHHDGISATEGHGLRADLRDAFADDAPTIELVEYPEDVVADVVVMLAGSTLPSDPNAAIDRAGLAIGNFAVFREYADALARRGGPAPWVVVQSNPVELGVAVFAEALGPDRVIGAGAYSDTLRFRREIADGLGRRRPQVRGFMVGQHGDHLVPAWSTVAVDGIDTDALADWIGGQRRDRSLAGLPDEIRITRDALVARVGRGEIDEAFRVLAGCPADLRAAVKPFLVHCTAGRTTEMVTAHAVADLIGILTRGTPEVVSVQVALDGASAGAGAGLTGVGAIPVTLDHAGWTPAPVTLAPDEATALRCALDAARALRAQMPDRVP